MATTFTPKQFRDVYLVCQNFEESKKAWELIANLGYDIAFRPDDYPDRWIYALNDRGAVYSVSLANEEEYLNSYWKKKRRLYYRDLFAPKVPLSEEITIQIIEDFRKLGAINEDTGLNPANLEKETKIDIGHCYDLVELKVLGNYNGRFFLKNDKRAEIKPEIKLPEEEKKPQKPQKPIKLPVYEDDEWLYGEPDFR